MANFSSPDYSKQDGQSESTLIATSVFAALGSLANVVTFVLFCFSFTSEYRRSSLTASVLVTGALIFIDGLFLVALTVFACLIKVSTSGNQLLLLAAPVTLALMLAATSSFITLAFAFIRFFTVRRTQQAKELLNWRNIVIYLCVVILGNLVIHTTAACALLLVVIQRRRADNGTTSEMSPWKIVCPIYGVVLHLVPGVAASVLLILSAMQFRKVQRRISSANIVGRTQTIKGQFKRSHVVMSVKHLILNGISVTLLVIHSMHGSTTVATVVMVIAVIHYGTTWIVSIFILPAFQESIKNMFHQLWHYLDCLSEERRIHYNFTFFLSSRTTELTHGQTSGAVSFYKMESDGQSLKPQQQPSAVFSYEDTDDNEEEDDDSENNDPTEINDAMELDQPQSGGEIFIYKTDSNREIVICSSPSVPDVRDSEEEEAVLSDKN